MDVNDLRIAVTVVSLATTEKLFCAVTVIETVAVDQIANWDAEDMLASRAFGDDWIESKRTAVLRVPGVVTHGREYNLVLNTGHPQFGLIRSEEPEAVLWDMRLFRH